MKIILLGCSLKEMINFRGHVIDWLLEQEHELFVFAPIDTDSHLLKYTNKKINFIFAQYSRGIAPKKEIQFLRSYRKHLQKIKPQLIFSYSLKASLYSMIANWGSINFYFVTGLGSGFINKKYKYLLKIILLSLRALRTIFSKKRDFFIFLNPDDASFFKKNSFCKKENALIFPGEGIDTQYFKCTPLESHEGPLRFLFIGRLIKDKGILELTAACKKLKESKIDFKCTIIAPQDKQNPTGLSLSTADFKACGIDYLAETNDIRSYIQNHDLIILPSYAEGMPRVLLEAMAIGRPIITTDVRGCRDLIVHKKNGFMVESKNIQALYHAMKQAIETPQETLKDMGLAGHEIIKEKYTITQVLNHYHNLIKSSSLCDTACE